MNDVLARMDAAAARAGRSDPVTLVVVTKYASDSELDSVIAGGARHLGESRAADFAARAARHPEVSWHFVGRLQGNKVRLVRPAAHLLHSMDRPGLVRYWSKGEVPPPVLVQVNVAGEPQKAGVGPEGVRSLIEACHASGIRVLGLMTVPPRPDAPSDSARWFSTLRRLRDEVAVDHPAVRHLSMGMSDDFEVAVEQGATVIRVGRAIFDPERNEG